MAPLFVQILFAIAGITTILMAVADADWFFTAQNTQFLVTRVGRTWARIIYGVLGAVMVGVSLYIGQ